MDVRRIRVSLLPIWHSSTYLAVAGPPRTLVCVTRSLLGCMPWRLRSWLSRQMRHRPVDSFLRFCRLPLGATTGGHRRLWHVCFVFFFFFFKFSVEDRCALLCSGAAGRSAWRFEFVPKSCEELRAVRDTLKALHSAAAARSRPPRQLKLRIKPTLDAPPPSGEIEAASTAASPHDATCSPALGKIPTDGSASFGKTGRVAVSAPSTQVAVVQTASSIPHRSNPSSGASLSSLLALTPPGLPVGKSAAALAQAPPSAVDGHAAGRRLLTRSQGFGAAPLKRQAPTCATETKRRRLSKEDAATAAWLSAFKRWRPDYEPDVAHDLVIIFSACDALLPSLITHCASGVAKSYPPVDRGGLTQWFVNVLNTGPGHGQARSEREVPSGGISLVMRSRVHGVFSAAYALHGTQCPVPRRLELGSARLHGVSVSLL